jgi:hypothetical protein
MRLVRRDSVHAAAPRFETALDERWLGALAADERAFVEAMAVEGAGRIALGAAGAELCDRVVADTEPLFAGGVGRVQDAWLRSDAARRLAAHPQILRLLQTAYGRRPFAFQTLSFRRGTQQALHSDTIHFNSDPAGFMAGVWIALEDIRPDAGPLVYKPGSHRLPVVSMADVGVAGVPTLADYERRYEPGFGARLEASGLPTRAVVLKKGEAFAWAANLAHGGAPILEPAATRRSLVVHYYFEGAVYYTPRLSDEPAGRRYLRLPADIGGRGWVWPERNGRPAPLPVRPVLAALKARLLRRPIALV